jgi:hypothetical protein
LEYECLAEAWKTVSIDPISGANQNMDMYWERIRVSFDECKLMDPVFNKVHMDRNPSGMSHRCGIIQQACNKCMESNKRSSIDKKAEQASNI